MSTQENPYAALPPERFWRNAVAERDGLPYAGIWRPRFVIRPETRFATGGSCFAQHISQWLQANGYQWLDAEPYAGQLTAAVREREAYGVFSFRTGNIYTAALLKQWIFWALDIKPAVTEVYVADGRYYDPFRPLIPQAGYASETELRQAQKHSLQCIRQTIEQTDIFVFTLGLTESWVNVAGYAYPMCPGTVRGEFDEALHKFENHDFLSILRDLNQTFDAMRQVNPGIRFLLTVSPVPLTASAADDHVLVATMYSKSVLRAVAGALKESREDVDYFPSYELISAFPMRARYYEKNLRSVTKAGVEFVMSHFASAIRGEAPAVHPAGGASLPESSSEVDVICDDVLLATWNKNLSTPESVALCLIGDSHLGKLSQSLHDLGVRHCGGMIMNGSAWQANAFCLDEDEFFVPLEDKGARERWRTTLRFFDAKGGDGAPQRTVILNIGMQSHYSVPDFANRFYSQRGNTQFSFEDASAYIQAQNEGKFSIIKSLLAHGYQVIFITDPPTQSLSEQIRPYTHIFELYDQVTQYLLENMGCKVFNARSHFKVSGFPSEFYAGANEKGVVDYVHGSTAYYRALAALVCPRFNC